MLAGPHLDGVDFSKHADMMAKATDAILGLIRQLRDMKGGVDFTPGVAKVKNMPDYARLCGWTLAMAHAKSGDPAAIAGYLGKSDAMDEAVTRFAFAYAEQTDRDHDALAKAAKAKRIQVAKAV